MSRPARSPIDHLGLPRNPLFRLLIANAAIGLAVSALLIAGIFITDTGHLRTLVANAENPVLPVLLLSCGVVVTLTSVVIGSAIMMLGSESERGGGPGHRRRDLVPVPVAAKSPRRG